MSWPDGGTTPFRGEKNTNWEGGYRVPFVMRWPGTVKPGTIVNDICAHEDWVPTLLAVAGEPDVKQKLLTGYTTGNMTYKVHLARWLQLVALLQRPISGRTTPKEFLYCTDDGDLAGLRFNKWKLVCMEQRAHSLDVWQDPMIPLRFPKLFNLQTDPFERAD